MAGTTNEKLELLRQTKADLKAALIERGKSPGDVFAEYPDMVRNIGDPAAPEIDVSDGGLITATASGKATTEQLPVEAGKTVNAGSVEKVVVEAGKYVTGDIKVAAVAMDGANVSGVTAEKNDVREFMVFVDAEGNEKVGTQPTRTASDLIVKKRHITVPAGIYDNQAELEVPPVIEYQPKRVAWPTHVVVGNIMTPRKVSIRTQSKIHLPSGVEHYYNRKRFPEIPAWLWEDLPYAAVVRRLDSARMVLSSAPLTVTENGDTLELNRQGKLVEFVLNDDVNAWELESQYNTSAYQQYLAGTSELRTLWWSNHDIYLGNELYWKGGELRTDEDNTPVSGYACVGLYLPPLPEETLATHPYAFIRKNKNSGYFELFCSDAVFYGNATQHPKSANPTQKYRTPIEKDSRNEWEALEESTGSFTIDDSRILFWLNYDTKKTSADTSDVYRYGTPNVPM